MSLESIWRVFLKMTGVKTSGVLIKPVMNQNLSKSKIFNGLKNFGDANFGPLKVSDFQQLSYF